MSEIAFEWDPRKEESNQRKHKISFVEAQAVFGDECAVLMDDPDHSANEDRFIILGQSNLALVLVVVHTYSDDLDVIRIISARKATKFERTQYNVQRTP